MQGQILLKELRCLTSAGIHEDFLPPFGLAKCVGVSQRPLGPNLLILSQLLFDLVQSAADARQFIKQGCCQIRRPNHCSGLQPSDKIRPMLSPRRFLANLRNSFGIKSFRHVVVHTGRVLSHFWWQLNAYGLSGVTQGSFRSLPWFFARRFRNGDPTVAGRAFNFYTVPTCRGQDMLATCRAVKFEFGFWRHGDGAHTHNLLHTATRPPLAELRQKPKRNTYL